jgi:hypothetical protein
MSKKGRGRTVKPWPPNKNPDARKKRHSRAYKAMNKIYGKGSDDLPDAKWNREFDKVLEAKRHARFKQYLDRKREPH